VYATATQRVCAWADQSSSQSLFLSNGTQRPLWTAAGVGGQAAVDFDVAQSYLSVGGVLGIAPTAGRTFVAVVRSVNTTARFQLIQQGQAGTPGTYLTLDANTFQTAGSREGVYVTNNAYDSNLATSQTPNVHVFTIGTMVPPTPVLATIEYRVNGLVRPLTRTPGGLGNGNVENFSGANYTLVGGGSSHALIAEALIYDRPLTTLERDAVATALMTRYAIQ
jgi:hypothetical protein